MYCAVFSLIYIYVLTSIGMRAKDTQLLCRGKRVSAIGIMGLCGLLDVYTTSGSVNEEVFLDFLERSLLPQLLPFDGVNPHSVVLMDNAAIHHTDRVVTIIRSTGALLHFIPPYSPDLNPIEECFSKVKAYLKEHSNEMQPSNVEDCVMQAFCTVTSDNCAGWFNHAGYINDHES